MTTNGNIPVGDTEMAECDGEEVVTMMDVLKEQQDFEDDANAVLGGSDEKECTYTQGYIKRQAIYSCLTCCPESKDDPSKRAGFCLACSLNCHENHDLVELYTKRNFRCDCGNPKFKNPCQFTPNKPDLNEDNIYNQNFIGLYCICSKPYGDQESTLDDEMIQCIICEDWWHASHLDAVIPAHDQYAEMICKVCMAKNEFLHDYSDLTINVETGDVDVVKVNGGSTVIDEKLTNGIETDEKLLNGTATDEKQTNGNKEDSACNDMDTSATEASTEDTETNNDNEESSAEKETIEPEKLDIETVTEKPVENKSTDVPMETDETDKAAEVIPEVSSEDTPETKSSEVSADKTEESEPSDKTEEAETLADKTEGNEPSANQAKGNDPAEKETIVAPEDKTEAVSTSSVEKSEETNEASAVKTAENITTSAEKQDAEPNENTVQSMADAAETLPTESKENESTDPESQVENASTETEKSSENIDSSESKGDLAEDQEKEKLPDAEKKEIKQDSATESPSDETHDPPSDNTTDETKATETLQDEDMNDLSKGNEKIYDDTPAANDEDNVSKDENTADSKENDSSKKFETNENIVSELPNTENKRKMSTEDVTDDNSAKKPKIDSKCVRPKGMQKVHKGATFWSSSFRQKLCTCSECISMYKDLSVLFLIDLEDTVFAYETLGKERTAGKPNQYEKGIEALCSLGRIQQIDALTEYNRMRDKLLSFLQSFKDRKEIVTEKDIKTFFAGMKPEKRTDGVYFCR